MKKLVSLMVVAMLMLMITPVFADGHEKTITGTVAAAAGDEDDPEFTILAAALTKADLLETFDGTDDYTVFAPTDAAFEALLAELDIDAEDLLAHPQLEDVLAYHVAAGTVMSTDLSNEMEITTLQGEKLIVDLSDGVKIEDATGAKATVDTPDVMATNGVIHIIDAVLVPAAFVLEAEEEEEAAEPTQSIVEIALGNPDFSTLVAALKAADLVGALSADGPFTVFAPTNAAFADLLDALDITAEELLAQPDLAKVLLHHVVAAKVMAGDLEDGMEAKTLNEDMAKFDLTGEGAPSVNGASITATDIEATNGVIHVISSVMIPTNFEYQEIEHEEEDVPETGSNSLYPVAALIVIGLGSLVAGKQLAKQKDSSK